MNSKLLIIGASGHGKVVAEIAAQMNKWKEIAFLDDNYSISTIMGYKIIGTSDKAKDFLNEYDIFVGIGNNSIRHRIYNTLESLGATIPVLIHPNAVISQEVKVKEGTVIMPGVVINSCSQIGKGCIINTGATIDHDNVLEDFVHISPGVHLAGTVKVGRLTWLGIGSIVSNNVTISTSCMVGAGGVVVEDLNKPGTYIGVPVRRIGE